MVIVGRIRSQVKARTIRKLTGGGGRGGEVQKKYSHKGKLNEKNSRTPINPKKILILWPKKIHTRNLITKKRFLRFENSPPPHNFSNGASLNRVISL